MRKTALALAAAVVLPGCATIIDGSRQELTFNSEPQGANVAIGNVSLGKTPLTTKVKRQKKISVMFEKDGYRPQTAEIESGINYWLFGNILVGGLIGISTDAYSGALNQYAPDHYLVTLKPVDPLAAVEASPASTLRALVTGSGPDLRPEIAAGSGTHLDAVLKLAGVDAAGREQAIAGLRRLADETPDNLELANRIVQAYGLH